MFSKALIHQLRKDLAHEKAVNREWSRRYDELLDRTIFSKRPERLITSEASEPDTRFEPSDASDAYTKAMQDAERLAQESRNGTD